MRLYLIRHGETVDNVAGLYAGVRDSALTNHGVEQARRLGQYLTDNNVNLSHIFSSPLSRACKTAEALRNAPIRANSTSAAADRVQIVKVQDLIEQDFGFYEGKPFYARSDPKKTGRESHYETYKNEPGFVDVESRESMGRRADAFLDQHLLPLLRTEDDNESVVAVVSHGMLLANLWRRLLLRLPRKSLSIEAEVTAARGNVVLEHLGGWSNTGYLELVLRKAVSATSLQGIQTAASSSRAQDPTETPPTSGLPPESAEELPSSAVEQKGQDSKPVDSTLDGWVTTIVAIDSKQHLTGLKRQRGGIGRSAHDEGQKKLDGFFKRQKKG